MKYWLLKSEPETWSWENQKKIKKTEWDGVRNYQARNNITKMKNGDLCFFYHSGAEKQIMGTVKIIREYYPDPSDETGNFYMINVKTHNQLKNPVKLKQIKNYPSLSHLALVKQSRLSVMPIDKKSWEIILKMSENE